MSCSGGTKAEGYSKVTPMLAFSPTSVVLPKMTEVLISSKTYLKEGTFGAMETVYGVGIMESVNIGDDNGMEI